MAEVSDKQDILLQTLRYAGCGNDVIAARLRLAEENETAKLLRVLSTHRNRPVETMHDCHKEIDCLDYQEML